MSLMLFNWAAPATTGLIHVVKALQGDINVVGADDATSVRGSSDIYLAGIGEVALGVGGSFTHHGDEILFGQHVRGLLNAIPHLTDDVSGAFSGTVTGVLYPAGFEERHQILSSQQSLVDFDPSVAMPAPSLTLVMTAGAPTPSTTAFAAVAAATAPSTTPTAQAAEVNYDPAEVQSLLTQASPELGDFWKSRGSVSRLPVARRSRFEEIPTFGASTSTPESKVKETDRQSKALEKAWVRVPDDWDSFQVATFIFNLTHASHTSLAKAYEQYLTDRQSEELWEKLRTATDKEPISVSDLLTDIAINDLNTADIHDLRNATDYVRDPSSAAGGYNACAPRYQGGRVVGSMGVSGPRSIEPEDDPGARMDARLSLFNLVRGRYKAKLELELEALEASGNNPGRVHEIKQELKLDYKNVEAIHAEGIGKIITSDGRERIFSRGKPRHEIIELVGANFYAGAQFYRLELNHGPETNIDHQATTEGVKAFLEFPVTEDEFFGLTDEELHSVFLAGVSKSKFERDAIGWSLDHGQAVLDVFGMIPVIGDVIDVVNGMIYALRGKYGDAAFSTAAIIPVFGTAAPAAKAARAVAKHADELRDQVKRLEQLHDVAVIKNGVESEMARNFAKQLDELTTSLDELAKAAKYYDEFIAPRGLPIPAEYPILNIGSGHNPMQGAVNVERFLGEGVDVVADARRLPFTSGAFDEVVAINPAAAPTEFFNPLAGDVGRVLKLGGTVTVVGQPSNYAFRQLKRLDSDALAPK